MPIGGLDVGRDVFHEADGDLVEELEVVGAYVAPLIDVHFPAVHVLRLEDQVNCDVTLAVVGPPSQIIVELVRGARPAAKLWHAATGAAALPTWGSLVVQRMAVAV